MRHSPGFYQRLFLMVIRTEVARAAVALMVMAILALADFDVGLVLGLPLLIYLGLWLATSTSDRPPRPRDKLDDYTSSLELRRGLTALTGQVRDDRVLRQLHGIGDQLDRILAAIAEDEKFDAATPLLSLIGLTKDLLTKYNKVMRRGFDDAGTHDRVRDNLVSLSASYQEFWERLNRDVIVDLDALSETIRELLIRLASPPDAPGLIDGLPEPVVDELTGGVSETKAVPVPVPPRAGREKADRLTRRELEVLCLLAQAKTDQQIAEELFISRRTVTSHITAIFEKLEVESRTAAAIYAVRHGLCDPSA